MSLIDQIAERKKELTEVLDKKESLENEIAKLEEKWNSEKINNQGACLNPIKLIEKGCGGCIFEDRCSYEGRDREFKL